MKTALQVACAAVALAIGCLVAALGLGVIHFPEKQLMTDGVEERIASSLSRALDVDVRVVCPPKVPLRKGKIYDCTAWDTSDPADKILVRVTEDDGEGHYTFQPTDQSVPAESV